MLRCLLWLSILLALPGAARADDAGAVASTALDGVSTVEGADASADAAPGLDLSFDPEPSKGPLLGRQVPGPVAPLAVSRNPGPEVEAPFSLGVDIKSGRDMGSPASRATSEPEGPQNLTDKVEGVVRHSTFGLTGTYRF